MDNCPKISIIVPVYKVESFLPQCIESILAQFYTDFELLLIDDGSPDKSGEVCDEFATRDIRIRVFHKENGGVSSARNLGLENARGEWVAFVDSDDYCGTNFISPVFNKDLDGIDVIQVGFYREKSNFSICVERQKKEEIINSSSYFTPRYCKSVCWAHFFRKKVFQDNGLQFNTQLSYSEDKEFIYKAVLLSKKIMISTSVEYFYRFNRNSAVNVTRKYAKSRSDLIVLMNIDNFLLNYKEDIDSSVKSFLFTSLSKAYLYSLPSCNSIYESRVSIRIDLKSIIEHPYFKNMPLSFSLKFRLCYLLPELMIAILRERLVVANFMKNRILFL